jgi:hypothetical protein
MPSCPYLGGFDEGRRSALLCPQPQLLEPMSRSALARPDAQYHDSVKHHGVRLSFEDSLFVVTGKRAWLTQD